MFTYDGRLTGNEESPIYGIKFAAIQNDFAFLLYPSRWFPVSGYTADRFTSKMNITVPQGFQVIGSGSGSHANSRRRDCLHLRFHQAFVPRRYRGRERPAGQEFNRRTHHDALVPRRRRRNMAEAYGDGDRADDEPLHHVFGLAPYANLTVVETADGAPNGYCRARHYLPRAARRSTKT